MALVLLVVLAVPGAGWAQHVVNKFAYDGLIEAQEAIDAGRTAEAREILETLREKESRLNDHEKALLYQSYGYLEAGEERYPEAVGYLEKSLAQEALPDAGQLQTLYNLAQLYLATERFPEAVKALSQWLRASKERPSPTLYMLAAAYYQDGKRDKALTPAILAVRKAEKPKEAWLQLLLSLYVERREYEKAQPVLEKLTNLYPKKVYWMQLAAVYGELEQEKKSLAALELVYTQGLMDKDDELRRLARLYVYHELPYLGAQVMEKGLADGIIEQDSEAYEILANAWMRAREFDRAIAPLTEAAGSAEDGKLFLRLGQAYAEKEDWGAAASALKQAISKGGLEEQGTASLLLGVAFFNQDQLEPARRHFARAAQHEKTRRDAEQWMKLIDRDRSSSAGSHLDEIADDAALGS
jgi:tetratricopeptide (TPR) repeat protein